MCDMKTLRNSKRVKVIAVFMVVNLISQIIVPNIAWALTSGPSQPEFSSFEPVTTTNMVDPFTGAFTYNLPVLNVPGPNGGGYAVSLSYHSGVTPEEEASWVGLGWSLNPGAINRNKRGIADDVYGEDIITHHKSTPSHTVVFTPKIDIEKFSLAKGLSASIRYNNYKGYARDLSYSMAALGGRANINFSKSSDSDFGISATVNPAKLLKFKHKKDFYGNKLKSAYNSFRIGQELVGVLSAAANQYGMAALRDVNIQMIGSETVGTTLVADFTGQFNPSPTHFGPELGGSVSYTFVENKEKSHLNKSYGYLYMSEGNGKDDVLTDFSIEKESPYNNRDNYLPAPFSNKDVFALSGEGAGGSFQVFHKSVGHTYRTHVKSESKTFAPSVDLAWGANSGVGFGVGFGGSETEFESWDISNSSDYQFSSSKEAFFRFNGDLAGNVQYSNPDVLEGKLYSEVQIPGVNGYVTTTSYQVPSDIYTEMVGKKKASSFVNYNTVEETIQSYTNRYSGDDVYYRAFDKSVPGLNSFLDYKDVGGFKKTIAEISTVNMEGQQMNYGLPVYNANEKSMSYSVEGFRPYRELGENDEELSLSKYLTTRDISNDDDIETKSGTESFHKYAATYLLTSIVNSDYIDRTFDGPTADDFGGWTKFNYKKTQDEYHWRIPYAGLFYNPNAKINTDDDVGSMSSADKEIYFLETIETKTHIAYFVTNRSDFDIKTSDGASYQLQGSGEERQDAFSSADDLTAAKDKEAQGTKEKEMLERIVLFAKAGEGIVTGRPIQTTHFDYEDEDQNGDKYSLCKGTFNSKNGNGKLTLKRVWFEHEGIKNARIRPYEFNYEYADYSNAITAQYSDIATHADGVDGIENPDYDYNISDPWGNYRGDGLTRDEEERPWIDQGNTAVPNEDFDPAAWHLKQIVLPSGGEIHVQYEQNDYAHVQNKDAMALVRLKGVKHGYNLYGLDVSSTKYELDLSDLPSGVDLSSYKNKLQKVLAGEKVYFKFLYKLISQSHDFPDINDCRSDFISGWMHVRDVELDGGKIYLIAPSDDSNRPDELCKDIVKKNYKGLTYKSQCYESGKQWMAKDESLDLMDVYSHMSGIIGTTLPGDSWIVCGMMDKTHSYVRVPVPHSKRGGGVRVKRLLSYSNGIETGDESLYGTEYHYEMASGVSSGVATNEPYREENPLVYMLKKRDDRGWLKKITSGVGKDQFEGPYGESVLPSPSIGYRRVVVSNIHKGETAPGFAVEHFNTAYEYPIKFEKDNAHIPKVEKFMTGPTPIYQANKRWAKGIQEYVIIKNDMHGKPALKQSYRGAFVDHLSYDEKNLVASTTFKYFNYKSKIPVLSNDGTITYDFMGRTEDVIMDGRKGVDKGKPIQVEHDPSFAPPVALMYSLMNYVQDNHMEFKRHVTTKVINYSSLVQSVTTTQKGISSTVKNLAFDSNTGQAVITSTTDGFNNVSIHGANHDGRYLSYNIPAAKVYPHLGQKIQNEGFVMEVGSNLSAPITLTMDCIGTRKEWLGNDPICQNNASFINLQSVGAQLQGKGGDLYQTTTSPVGPKTDGNNRTSFINALDNGELIEGDLIELSNGESSSDRALYYINEIDLHNRHRIYLNPVSFVANNVDPKSPSFTRLEVISSGYTNQLSSMAASVTTYGKDVVDNVIIKTPNGVLGQNTGEYVQMKNYGSKVAMGNDFRNVVASSAAQYSDDWYNYQLTNTYDDVDYSCLKSNTFETGARGKWRPKSTYVYKEDLLDNNEISKKGYVDYLTPYIFRKSNIEVYDYKAFYETPYDFNNPLPISDRSTVEDYMSSHEGSSTGEIVNNPIQDSKWVKTNTITMYSPNGEALEEENIMGIRSAAKFSYGDNVPVAVASNAPYRSILFEGFDDRDDDFVTSNKSHSGNKSGVLETNQEMVLGKFEAVPNSKDINSAKLKMWLHASAEKSNLELTLKRVNQNTGDVVLDSENFKEIAKVGEWILLEYDAIILQTKDDYRGGNTFHSRGPGEEYQVHVKNLGPTMMFIDDLRVQPSESQMTAYVYNSDNLRLLSTFDDQHFGLFYQYNAEGKLVRKLIETERGVKTVTETQYHTPQKDR